MTHRGSCVCGACTHTIEGDPAGLAVCHCVPCPKTSSCSASNNFSLPADKLHLSGPIKTYAPKGQSGNNVTYHFCSVCPTIRAVDTEAMEGQMIVKPGTLDGLDLLNRKSPDTEIFTKNRYRRVKPVDGAEQKEEQ